MSPDAHHCHGPVTPPAPPGSGPVAWPAMIMLIVLADWYQNLVRDFTVRPAVWALGLWLPG